MEPFLMLNLDLDLYSAVKSNTGGNKAAGFVETKEKGYPDPLKDVFCRLSFVTSKSILTGVAFNQDFGSK